VSKECSTEKSVEKEQGSLRSVNK